VSINKYLGQSLKTVGLDLQNPCLACGQLYVGCLKINFFFILAPHEKTSNVLYNEALWTLYHEFFDNKNRKCTQVF